MNRKLLIEKAKKFLAQYVGEDDLPILRLPGDATPIPDDWEGNVLIYELREDQFEERDKREEQGRKRRARSRAMVERALRLRKCTREEP